MVILSPEMQPDLSSIVSSLNKEYLYSLAREGYRNCIQNNSHLIGELGVPLDQIVLKDMLIQVIIRNNVGTTLEIRIDIIHGPKELGYYALVLEENFTFQDDFFVIHS
jgi:hypothetical protein